MSLPEPNQIEKILAWPYLKITAIGIGLLLLIALVAFTVESCGESRVKKSDQKKKDEIVNTAREISNVNAQIGNLMIKQGELRGKLERDTEDLQNNIFGLDDAKTATNQALANLNQALNTNSNVNRTAEDLQEVLRRLER